MRHVNKYLIVAKFRYENLRAVRDIIEENDYFATFDLRSGYHQIPIAKEHQKYLGFAWDFTAKTRFFVFVILPFGLVTAGHAFSKVMKSFMKKWRAEGKRTSLYLDDGIIVGKDIAVTEKTTADMKQDMLRAGLIINHSKSRLTPSQHGSYLGFLIDTQEMTFTAPAEKISHLQQKMSEPVARSRATPHDVSKIAGHLISLSPAFGSLSQLFTHQMYRFIEAREFWYQRKLLPDAVRQECTFWLKTL